MKAAVYTSYGPADVVQITDVEKPIPKDDEVLIRVEAASVNPLDWKLMTGKPYFIRLMARVMKLNLKRPGVDVAGQVEAVGRNVTQFKPGDEIFGDCRGAFAEYVCVSQSAVVTKPENVTFEQAASVNLAGLTALQALRNKGQIQPGQKVLINGAAGGVGTFAVQIAKSFGAIVTGICSATNVDMVRSIGADNVIDYTREDFTESGQRYDVVLDNIGNHPFSAIRRILTPKGRYIMVGGPHGRWMISLIVRPITAVVSSLFLSQKAVMVIGKSNKADLSVMGEFMTTGKVTPVIDRCYSLSEVSEALRYLEEGHVRGKIVINFEG